ncbi:MAG: hypothetical protein Q8Q04_02590 [archaeon]|nr:hypothetical protein [archaeon]
MVRKKAHAVINKNCQVIIKNKGQVINNKDQVINNKGQVKVQQMAFMIIGLSLFFVVVGLFVLSFAFSGLKESKALLDEKEATLLVERLSNAPEFSCGNAFSGQRSNCIDLDKAFALKEKIEEYDNFFGVEGITIRVLYPFSTTECTLSNYPNCGKLTVLEGGNLGIDKSDFVSLCRKEKEGNSFYDKCELGELIVRVADDE